MAQKNRILKTGIIFAALALLLMGVNALVFAKSPAHPVPYSQLMSQVRDGNVTRVEMDATKVRAQLQQPFVEGKTSAKEIVASRLPNVEDSALLAELDKAGVEVVGKIEKPSVFSSMFLWFGPLLLFAIPLVFLARAARSARSGPLSMGKSKAKIYDANNEAPVTFSDVAGVNEAKDELREVVSFLREPERYQRLGAKIPKGVLLVGPPGTGKTLLARAVAGEADVPFFSLSGSDFMEMFVGVGASRVRDLFEQAKRRAPCIIFIDEIDGIGRARGGVALGGHGEQEQTLNQLLSEMDGFDGQTGVIIMAATNRPEVLDPALVRAGRFDRQIVVDRPDLAGRKAVLEVHTREVPVAADAKLEVIARRTPGMVGADLARVVNEAALGAARRGARLVEQPDFEAAVDRILLGLEQRGRVLTSSERRRVSYHESGHALVALSVAHADPVHRVSIIPRSIGALGVTLQLPEEERYLMTKDGLTDRICVMLGGRAAEELECSDVSTGASDDLERATETARQMICRFGMSDELGIRTFGRAQRSRFLGATEEQRDFSEETARKIDAEVAKIIETQYRRALEILRTRANALRNIAERLLEVETMTGDDLAGLTAA